jgi:hypothetical protein
MIGFIIFLMRGFIKEEETDEVMKKAFNDLYLTPKAPGLGLQLAWIYYDNFNRRNPEIKIGYEQHSESINEFRNYIKNHIVEEEKEKKVFSYFVYGLSFWFLNKSEMEEEIKKNEEVIIRTKGIKENKKLNESDDDDENIDE